MFDLNIISRHGIATRDNTALWQLMAFRSAAPSLGTRPKLALSPHLPTALPCHPTVGSHTSQLSITS